MALAKITVIGLETHGNFHGSSLFDDIVYPDGLDKEMISDTILLEAGEFEPLYADYEFYQFSVKHFFKKYLDNFSRMKKVLEDNYEPLWNVDRYEKWSDEGTSNETSVNERDDYGVADGKANATSDSTVNEIYSGDTETKVSAYDANTYLPKEVNITGYADDTTSHGETESTSKNTNTFNTKGSGEVDSKNESSHDGHYWGNAGVTMSQQMLEAEMGVRDKYNIYDVIAHFFIRHLCVATYD